MRKKQENIKKANISTFRLSNREWKFQCGTKHSMKRIDNFRKQLRRKEIYKDYDKGIEDVSGELITVFLKFILILIHSNLYMYIRKVKNVNRFHQVFKI